MGQPQRQEYLLEMLYGNGEPASSKMNSNQREVLSLGDLVDDPIYFELSDLSEAR